MTEAQSISGTTGLNEQLKKFWELESLGITKEEKSLYDQFVSFIGESYHVTLPWRDTFRLLPDNYQLSLRRLNGLLRGLRQQPALFEQYSRVITEQIAKGIAEVVGNPNMVCGEGVN
uniref:Uncharacterized protein n=1 Tax=Amphimedon queenslandica TaxID=400682 RepID=A0A1X7VE19_AMPQE